MGVQAWNRNRDDPQVVASLSMVTTLRKATKRLLPKRLPGLTFAGGLLALTGCSPHSVSDSALPPQVLARVGRLEVRESDLLTHLDESHAGRRDSEARQIALAELVRRCQLVQSGLDAGLMEDPKMRAEISKILAYKASEDRMAHGFTKVVVAEDRLRELYEEQLERYQTREKRRVAVLWLDPGKDPERLRAYRARLSEARQWTLEQTHLTESPEKGFAELAVDFSEHQESRFAGGIVGWLEAAGGSDKWTRAVAEIAFHLNGVGALSEVVTREEGVFLVRFVGLSPAVTRPFESVKAELEQQELRRLKQEMEASFYEQLDQAYPASIVIKQAE